jgi:hypothetical protein
MIIRTVQKTLFLMVLFCSTVAFGQRTHIRCLNMGRGTPLRTVPLGHRHRNAQTIELVASTTQNLSSKMFLLVSRANRLVDCPIK